MELPNDSASVSRPKRGRDWISGITTIVAFAGLLVAVFSLCLTVHWHRQAVEDRISLRLEATRSNGSHRGTLDAELVNIGMRPIYVQKVVLEMGKRDWFFFEHDNLTGVNVPTKPLVPGALDDFQIGWNFTTNPVVFDQKSGFFRLANSEGKDVAARVCIQTTRAVFHRPANISKARNLSSSPSPKVENPGKRQLKKRGRRRPAPPQGLRTTVVFTQSSPGVANCP